MNIDDIDISDKSFDEIESIIRDKFDRGDIDSRENCSVTVGDSLIEEGKKAIKQGNCKQAMAYFKEALETYKRCASKEKVKDAEKQITQLRRDYGC